MRRPLDKTCLCQFKVIKSDFYYQRSQLVTMTDFLFVERVNASCRAVTHLSVIPFFALVLTRKCVPAPTKLSTTNCAVAAVV